MTTLKYIKNNNIYNATITKQDNHLVCDIEGIAEKVSADSYSEIHKRVLEIISQ